MRRAFCFLVLMFVGIAIASDVPHDWVALYKNGMLDTKYKHYVTLADGVAGPKTKEFGAEPGHAVFSMKAWALSVSDAARMARLFANRAGFEIEGKVEVYTEGEPTSPPRQEPYGYAIKFYPYDQNKKEESEKR